MKASRLLRMVRDDMVDPHGYVSTFICDNVRARGSKTPAATETAERICDHIDTLLDGAFSLREWLVINGHAPELEEWDHKKESCYHGPIDEAKLFNTRIAWLADLISHYETQGD